MKILYVGHKPAVPQVDGGTIAMKQFIELLTLEHTSDAFVLSTFKHPFTEESKQFYSSHFNEWQQDLINTKVNPFKLLWSVLLGKSYILDRFKSVKLQKFIAQNSYDVIVCDSLFSMNAIDTKSINSSTKIILRSHNFEFEIWKEAARQQKGLKRLFFNFQSARLKKAELRLIERSDVNLCISDDDLLAFTKLIPSTKHSLLSMQLEVQETPFPVHRKCYFMGSDNWQPNIDTVNYLLKVFSQPDFSQISLSIAGGFKSYAENYRNNENISFHGKVENASEFALDNGILVTPAFSGSGIRVKILEALSLGIPCITNKNCAKGINNEAGLILVESADELKNAVLNLQSNDDLYQSLSLKGKTYIQKYHSFAAVKSALNDAFEI